MNIYKYLYKIYKDKGDIAYETTTEFWLVVC